MGLAKAILGGDPFSDAFRGLYDPGCYWKLTDPDYCLSVMEAAYAGGCRAFDFSFGQVQEVFLRLQDRVGEPLDGYGNPTYLQGVMLEGRHLQFLRDRVLKTIAARMNGAERDRFDRLGDSAKMVFGFDRSAEPLSDREIGAIRLDERVFLKRLSELGACRYVLVGGTDADWLFTLGRADIIGQMSELVRSLGKKPLLLCHYASTVLPAADRVKLDVDGYFAPINSSWAWFSLEAAKEAVRQAKKPVIAFMAFACGGLKEELHRAARFLRDECGVAGVLYGTTKPRNAEATAALLLEVFGGQNARRQS